MKALEISGAITLWLTAITFLGIAATRSGAADPYGVGAAIIPICLIFGFPSLFGALALTLMIFGLRK